MNGDFLRITVTSTGFVIMILMLRMRFMICAVIHECMILNLMDDIMLELIVVVMMAAKSKSGRDKLDDQNHSDGCGYSRR